MANIRKSFNFRNGVQVDDSKLIVDSLGKVGIGTSVPTELLDVRGTAKIVGVLTATQIEASYVNIGITTAQSLKVNGNISLSSGIITASSGILTYYGDGSNLSNIPTSQWKIVDQNTIYSEKAYVGIATNFPYFSFQVGGIGPLASFQKGVGISSDGNIYATGFVTATSFSGNGFGLTNLNGDNIGSGTISTDRIPVLKTNQLPNNINASGIITATGGFVGNISGNVTGNISGNVTGNVTGNVIGNVTGNVIGNLSGTATTATSLTGNPSINTIGIITSNGFVGNLTGNVTGNLSGTATTALNVASTANLSVVSVVSNSIISASSTITGGNIISNGSISCTNLNSTGIITAGTRIYSGGSVGIQTNNPQSNLHVVNSGISSIQITGSTESTITLGRSLSQRVNTGSLKFGNTSGLYPYSNTSTLDVINYDSGSLNNYIHLGNSSGINTGNFNWIYGKNILNPLMTLTYKGNLGLGITNPSKTLEVNGIGTFISDLYVGNKLYVNSDININGDANILGSLTISSQLISNVSGDLYGNVNSVSGISYFNDINVSSAATITRLNVATQDNQNQNNSFQVESGSSAFVVSGGRIGVGTDSIKYTTIGIDCTNSTISASIVGVGTTDFRSAVDFSSAGSISPGYSFMIPPVITTTQRVGLNTVEGALIYNKTTKKHQGYDGSTWHDFY